MCLNDRPLTDKWCSPSVMPPQPGPTCRGCLVIGQRQWALILVVLEMAVAGRRMMEVIVSVPVTTCHYQPGPGSWDTPTPSWSGYLRCTELQTTKYAVSVHLPGNAMLLYLNTRSNIETKGQMSGPKPEPASGGKRGKGLGARVTRSPAPAAMVCIQSRARRGLN